MGSEFRSILPEEFEWKPLAAFPPSGKAVTEPVARTQHRVDRVGRSAGAGSAPQPTLSQEIAGVQRARTAGRDRIAAKHVIREAKPHIR